jgi:ubiquinone/menaquinone biosynthesis C-methylase UbiE
MKTNWVERLWIDGPWRIPFQAAEIRHFQRLRSIPPGGRALEIGCGRGAGARLILESFQPARVDAIDIDPAMIRRAQRGVTPRLAGRLDFRVADAQDLPFPTASMDAVFNFGILHHLEDWRKGIREIARVLKPGGVFCFEEIYPALYAGFILKWILVHPRHDRFDGLAYRQVVEGAGMDIIEGYHESKYSIVGVAVRNGRSPM